MECCQKQSISQISCATQNFVTDVIQIQNEQIITDVQCEKKKKKQQTTCCDDDDDDVSLTLLVLELALMTFCRALDSFCFCKFSRIDAISGLGDAASDNSDIWKWKRKWILVTLYGAEVDDTIPDMTIDSRAYNAHRNRIAQKSLSIDGFGDVRSGGQ